MAGRRRTRRYRPFTVKGMDVLSKAEVVVYDSLVGQGVLSQIPLAARLINVGKRANQHTMPQEQINEVLLKEKKKGYRVVRLKWRGSLPVRQGRGGVGAVGQKRHTL